MLVNLRRFDGQIIPGALSTGSGRVFAAEDWRQMILGSPEGKIKAKALKGSPQLRSFREEDRPRLKAGLGLYSDVQSVNSEDTVTWSVFQESDRSPWLAAMLSGLFDPGSASKWNLTFWERTVHPEPQSQYGPEADLRVEGTGCRFVVECKWLRDIDDEQGKEKNKTQLDMRRFQCGDVKKSGILLIAPSASNYPPARDHKSVFRRYFAPDEDRYAPLQTAVDLNAQVVTWEEVVAILLKHDEPLRYRYLTWRLDLIQHLNDYLNS